MSTVLIAGASRGIGLELVRQAAARGDDVIACARDPLGAALRAVADAAGGRVSAEALDVTDPAACDALAARLAGRRIDLLVCNAGVYIGRGGMHDAPYAPQDWTDSFMANVAGVFFAIRALRPLLTAPGGRIAVISSQMGSNARANGGSYIYRASKAAATNLVSNLARDMAAEGIALGAYHPGWVRTDMGGDAAAISVEESAAGLLARFDALGPDTSGAFEGYDGAPVPF